MQGAVLHGARDIRVEEREEPTIVDQTDAVISLSARCICGSDLWPYRGIQPIAQPVPMGHEYCGIVEEVGREVRLELDGSDLFFRHVRLHGGPAPVRRYLPQLIDLVFNGTINPGRVFDLVLPLTAAAEGYRAMDERRAIKTLLRP